MSYRVDVTIKELYIRIPKADFPLKSNTIVGYEYPILVYLEDEGSESMEAFSWKDDYCYLEMKEFHCCDYGNHNTVAELEALCIKYKGTLIAEEYGEEPGEPTEYTRVRDGVRKKLTVKIEEE